MVVKFSLKDCVLLRERAAEKANRFGTFKVKHSNPRLPAPLMAKPTPRDNAATFSEQLPHSRHRFGNALRSKDVENEKRKDKQLRLTPA